MTKVKGKVKGKALRRALKTKDAYRLEDDVPLIVDSTECITPEIAHKMLTKNDNNRPVNWRAVDEYAKMMAAGEWKLHSQGIILDQKGNLLTGQKRLWAIIRSKTPQYMRISRGCPDDTANLIDRGTPQSARDISTRVTKKRHSPTEQSLARGLLALGGNLKPTKDKQAEVIAKNTDKADVILAVTKGVKKKKSLLMILSTICMKSDSLEMVEELAKYSLKMADELEVILLPETAERCWNRGPAFILALERSKEIVSKAM